MFGELKLRAPWRKSMVSVSFALFATISLLGQQPSNPSPTPSPTPPPTRPLPTLSRMREPNYGSPDPKTLTFEERQYRRFITYRLKSMSVDATKLQNLTRELDVKIKVTGLRSLSNEDIRKLGEIERLAHSIKSKMEFATSGNPSP